MAMEILNHTKNGLGMLMDKYQTFSQEMQQVLFENKKALAKLKQVTEEAIYNGGEKVKEAAIDAHRTVKKNPWAYIGVASAAALLVGFMAGKKK